MDAATIGKTKVILGKTTPDDFAIGASSDLRMREITL